MNDPTLGRLQTALGADLEIQRELGGGGMSRVFLARDRRLGREIVVKVLSPDLAATVSADRFTREISLSAALQEPHIVPVLTAGTTDDGVPWFTMPFVAGESLRERVAAGPLTVQEAVQVLRNVGQALAYAHARGIVHRDIKPENILLSSGTAMVADFGIAKAISASRVATHTTALTQAGMAVGTPAYMAPEQAAGDEDTDHRADVYAWGVLAFELLQGRHPFADRTTPAAMTAAHIATPAPAVTARLVPGRLRDLVRRCLAKDPADRPQAMRDVLRELDGSVTRQAAGFRPRVLVGAVAIVALVVTGWLAFSHRSDDVRVASVAVLPFEIGRDTANAYIADGLSSELTTKLAQIPGLVVRAYSSSRMLRGSDPRDAAAQLAVASVVTATVRRAGTQIHVNASVIRATDAQILWSQSLTGSEADQFMLQARLAEAVATALGVPLTQTTRAVVASAATTDPLAHDLVQRSRFLADQLTPDATRRAIDLASQAVARDSSYVDAWMALAKAQIATADDVQPAVELMPSTSSTIRRLAALAPRNPGVLALRGMYASWYERDTLAALPALLQALAIDSTNETALIAYAVHLQRTSPDSAAALLARALRFHPATSLTLYMSLWMPQVFTRMSADSSRLACQRLGSYVPELADACEASRLESRGDRAGAVAAWRRIDTAAFASPTFYAWRALAAANVNDAALMRQGLASVERVAKTTYVREDAPLLVAARLGDRDATLRWARRALASHVAGAVFLTGREFREFQSDSAFVSLVRHEYFRSGTRW